jgi:hypothetical protein
MSRRNAKHFERQGETTLSPQPPNQDCMDAVLLWKQYYEDGEKTGMNGEGAAADRAPPL